MIKHRLRASLFVCIAAALVFSLGRPGGAAAQTGDIIWAPQINLTNTPMMTSTDPFLLADPAGVVHLFWAEKVNTLPGGVPDTIMYSQWDGQTWTQPMDIFFAPNSDGNMVVSYPHAALDDDGLIHLIWLSQPNFPYYTLNYSSVPANQARYVQSWRPKIALAEELTGTKYSIHIAYSRPNTLHVVYARGATGESPNEERGVNYIRSTDGGRTWSEPVSIFTVPNLNWGASDTRLITDEGGGVFASWTMWNETGNGQAIYFSRSLDNGLTWDTPVMLTQNREGEYERDWNSLMLLPDKRLMAMWEGGYRAYRQVMYSEDSGQTWSEPVDLFPKLIGENGYVEFAYDSNQTLHLFYSQRIREGTAPQLGDEHVSGLWHSVWMGDSTWRDPVLSGGVNNMLNPKAVIVNGNTVVAAWYTSPEFEIRVMTGAITGAPELPKKDWGDAALAFRPTPTASPIKEAQPTATDALIVEMPTPAAGDPTPVPPLQGSENPALAVFLGAAPALLVVPIFLLVLWRRRRD